MAARSTIPLTLCAALLGTAAYAQAVSIDIPPGTIIPNGNWEVFKIVECGLDHAFLGYKECSVEIYREGELLGGGLRRYPAEQLLKDMNSAREAKGLRALTRDQASGRAPYPEAAGKAAKPAAPPVAEPAPPVEQPPATKPAAQTAAAGGPCPRTPYVELAGTQPPSAGIFRQVMASGHTFQRAAYQWTGVTFEAFSVGGPVKNVITMQPGVGPRRITDAAPVDTALYPVRATYVLCHQYASGPDRVRIRTGNYCFVSRTGKWACGTDSSVAKFESTPVT